MSDLKSNHEVVFYPSMAFPVNGGSQWACEIHGRVYRADKRRILLALLRLLRRGLRPGSKLSAGELRLFKQRARLFMVDNKRGRMISIRLGDQVFTVGRTKANGHFSKTIMLPHELIRSIQSPGLWFEAILAREDDRVFKGEIKICPQVGLTVISDIDDTIRITEVRDRRANLRRTFLQPFEAVAGMAEIYRQWAARYDAQFCYVSASPWQLFSPLSDFLAAEGFPSGTFYFRHFRWKDRSLLNVLASPRKYKITVIEKLLNAFPKRQIVLVGDTGEKDPEIYADLARRYPQQIVRVFLREVTGEPAECPRYLALFGDLPRAMWTIFRDPADICEASLGNNL